MKPRHLKLKKKEDYLNQIAKIPVKNLIFLDESGSNLQMVPRYGRAYGKSRAVMVAPFSHGNQITLISAISLEKIEAAMYGQWAANTEIFSVFIERHLCPVLRPKHVVVMDNIAFHKSQIIHELVEGTGAKIIYLPPYSAPLNPIEEMWSKIKAHLRRMSARTLAHFQKGIKSAYESVTQEDLAGWFKHAGYGSII